MYLTGEQNTANILLPESEIDQTTLDQIKHFLDHFPERSKVVVMPNCYTTNCYTSVVGLTFTYKTKLIPNLVGQDLGCGILGVQLKKVDLDLEQLDERLQQIPRGFKIHKTPITNLMQSKIREISKMINSKWDDPYQRALGTLGMGDHFIEIGEYEDETWIFIHAGSGYFGFDIATYFQNYAQTHANFQQSNVPQDLRYVSLKKKDGNDYLKAVKVAQKYAKLNRELLMKFILKEIKVPIYEHRKFQCVHNYIDTKDKIIRRGAIRAKNEPVLIPLNPEEGVIIGKGSSSWDLNFSGPQGLGRSLEKKYKDSKLILDQIKKFVKIEKIVKPIYSLKG